MRSFQKSIHLKLGNNNEVNQSYCAIFLARQVGAAKKKSAFLPQIRFLIIANKTKEYGSARIPFPINIEKCLDKLRKLCYNRYWLAFANLIIYQSVSIG